VWEDDASGLFRDDISLWKLNDVIVGNKSLCFHQLSHAFS
jgi:hypothetical protein